MKRFTKRLLTGVISGAMALSLFPVTGYGSYEAKAAGEAQAINPALLPHDTEDSILPGYYSWIPEWGYDVWDEENDRNLRTYITGVEIPKEYSGYASVDVTDEDNDGVLEGALINTQSERDEEGNIIVERSDKKEDAVGVSIPITISYRLESGYEGHLTHTLHLTDSVYEIRSYTSTGADSLLPGQSFVVDNEVRHRVAKWDEEFEEYYHVDVPLVNPGYSYSLYDVEDDRITITPNGEKLTITAREKKSGDDPDVFYNSAGIKLDFSENGEHAADFGYSTRISDHYYGLLPDNFEGLKDLKLGGSITIRPELKYYDEEKAPEGQVVDDVRFCFKNANEAAVNITDNEDGTYTIKRTAVFENDFEFSAEFTNVDGDEDAIDRRPYMLDIGVDGNVTIKEENNNFVVFSDTTARTFYLDVAKFESMFEDPSTLEINCKVGFGDWSENGFEFFDEFGPEDGVTVAADGRSVTVDGTKMINKFNTWVDGDGNKQIEGDDRFSICFTLKMEDSEVEQFFVEDAHVRYARVSYDTLFNSNDPEWCYDKFVLPGDTMFLDGFYYFVENDANPMGSYVPYNINVTEIKGYDFGENGGLGAEKFSTVVAEEVDGRPALKVATAVPLGAPEDSNLFGINEVFFTFVDADGKTRSGKLYVYVSDLVSELNITSINCSDMANIGKNEFGSYSIETLFNGSVSGSLALQSTGYDFETGEVKDCNYEISSLRFEEHWKEGGASVKINGDKFVISDAGATGDQESAIGGNFVAEYNYTWIDGDGIAHEEQAEQRIYIDVNFRNGDIETVNNLPFENLSDLKTINWTPDLSWAGINDETGEFGIQDSSNWHIYGFVYDQSAISITADGKEIGNGFSEGPFTFTSKIDKPTEFIMVLASYDPRSGSIRYDGNRKAFLVDGTVIKRDHSEHNWTESVAEKAGFEKEGTIVRTCTVGGEKETEVIPAIASAEITSEQFKYTGLEQTITVEVKDTEGNVIPEEDYVLEGASQTNVGLYRTTLTFVSDKYEGVMYLDWSITPKDIKELSISKVGTQAWTGSAIKPAVTIKDGKKTLKAGTDYDITYANNKNAGTATITIKGKGGYEGTKTIKFAIKKPVLKYRAYVQKKNWMSWQTAAVSSTPNTKTMAGTTDNLRMETIQMQLSGVGGEIKYRAYCQAQGWVGMKGSEKIKGFWATTADKSTNAGTKGEARRVEMIQLQTKGEISTIYDIYYQAYSEKFGWLAWAGNNEKAGSAGYAYKLEAFRVQLVPKGAKFDKTKGASKKKSFYDKTKDGANPK